MSNNKVYETQLERLNGRTSKKVANNTYLQFRPSGHGGIEHVALKYHATDVVTYYPDGRIVLDTGGWKTSTTKLRFNESYAELPVQVFADRGLWYVVERYNGNNNDSRFADRVPFADGLTLMPAKTTTGHVSGYEINRATIGEDPKRVQKLRQKVKRYAAGFIAALRAGEVHPPYPGDCLYCAARTVDGNVPLGEASRNSEHILSHIDERYYVGSLLVRASEVRPCSQVMKWAIGEGFQKYAESHMTEDAPSVHAQGTIEGMPDFAWTELPKMLAKYILRQLGEVA